MKRKKSVKASVAVMACLLAISSSGFQVLAADNPVVPVRSTSQTQMQSEPEMVYVNAVENPSERSLNFNDNWKFNLGDIKGAEAKGFDDSKWENVSVPHDYSIIQDYQENLEAESGYLPGGAGWYRKYFTVSEEMKDKRLRIDFDGVYMNATVYVNGQELGTHPFGYTPFSFDITDEVKVGEENVIAVKVDHKTPSSRWYSGSGIYRNVHLSVTDAVHVDLYGQKIETPKLKEQAGKNVTMKVDTTVVNEAEEKASVTVKHTVFVKGKENEKIAEAEGNAVEIAAGASQVIESEFGTTSAPALWSVKSPSLYTVRTEVKAGNQVLDVVEEDYGFRWFEMDKDTGASLNGEAIKLKGVCMHHDQGSLGSAAYRRAIERQVEILQEMGANSIRVTHNPAAEVLIDICNEKGMLVIDELFDGWMFPKNENKHDYSKWFGKAIGDGNTIIGGTAAMTWAEFDLKATLRRGQNDPSIIMWSLGNEIQEGAGGSGYNKQSQKLISWAQETDSTRMLTIGSNAVKNTDASKKEHVDIANQLTNVGGASGTNYSNGNSYDSLHSQYPQWKLYGSETASSVNSRGVYTTKRSGGNSADNLDENKQLTSYDKSKVPWGALASEAWYDVIQRDFVAGEYVWTGFDYIGEPTPANGISGGARGSWPSPKNSYFGIVDTAGFPKDSYYFYQSQWNENVKTLHVLPTWNEDTVMKDGKDKDVEVVVYSDAKKVELWLDSVNGESKKIGEQTFTTVKSKGGKYSYQMVDGSNDHTGLYMTFRVPFEEGTLRAVAYDENGEKITETKGRSSVSTTGGAAKLTAEVDRQEIVADGDDLTYIEVDVQDADGHTVPNADNRVKFKVEGDGELVGVDNGSSPDHDSYKADNRKAHAGKVLAIVRSTKKAGQFTVTASSDKLKSSVVTVKTTKPAGTETEKVIVGYKVSRNFYVKKGNQPSLPKEIEVHYSDGTKATEKVTWNEITEEQLNSTETFQVKGMVGKMPVVTNVTMISNIATLLNYSTTTNIGTAEFQLPKGRPAVLEDGTVLNVYFDVQWEKIPDGAFKEEGLVEVNGTANVFGQNKDVKATIRVQKEKIELGSNIAPQARLSQDIEEAYQSDTLKAIVNGSKDFKTGNTPNPTCWSNYKNSQPENSNDSGKNDPTATISMQYDTQQRLGQIAITFCRDSWSARFPKAGATKILVDDKPLEVTKEIIPENIPESGVGTATYVYEFAPVMATKVDLLITNTDEETGKAGVNPCTAISEVEIKQATGSFNTYETAALQSLTLNGTDLKESDFKKGYVETPAVVAELTNLAAKDNAAVTVLPAYNNVVKLIIESEDHKTMNVFEIRLDKEAQPAPDDESNDVTCEPGWVIAGNERKSENPKENVVDNDPNTHWHTDWAGGHTSPIEERWVGFSFPEKKLLDGLRYLPRHGGQGESNGRVATYEIQYRMSDQEEWKPVELINEAGETYTQGTWPEDTPDWLGARFKEPIEVKEIRLVGVRTIADTRENLYMSCKELRVTHPKEKTDISGFHAIFEEQYKDGVVERPYLEEGEEIKPGVIVRESEAEEALTLRPGIDYKVTYKNNTAFGDATATIEGIDKYTGKIELPFTIKQTEKTLQNIFADEDSYQRTYTEGEKFNPKGLTIQLIYSDLSEETVKYSAASAAKFTFKPGLDQALEIENKTVLVTYEGKTVELPITVIKKTVDPKPPVDPDGNNSGGGNSGGGNENGGSTDGGNVDGNHQGQSTDNGKEAVKTGDPSNVFLPIAGIMVAIALVTVVLYKKKKRG